MLHTRHEPCLHLYRFALNRIVYCKQVQNQHMLTVCICYMSNASDVRGRHDLPDPNVWPRLTAV